MPARVDRVASFTVELDAADFAAADAMFRDLESTALSVVTAAGAEVQKRSVRRLADMRYVGQGFEITVTLPPALSVAGVREVFEQAYRTLFGRTPPGATVQFVALRVVLAAPMPGSEGPLQLAKPSSGHGALKGRRRIHFHDASGTVVTDVYDRYALVPGQRLRGPAIFEENESTFVVGPDSAIQVLVDGTILVEMP